MAENRATVVERLTAPDLDWIAARIHECRQLLERHPEWEVRLRDLIDRLLWSASVDGREGTRIVQDAWVRPGNGLRLQHFQNVEHTKAAMRAFKRNRLSEIRREHIVPRRELNRIVRSTSSLADTARVLKEYAVVCLVHETECRKLRPSASMPKGWASDIDWARLPEQLPTRWARYRDASSPIVVFKGDEPVSFWP